MKRRWMAVGVGAGVTFLWASSYILNQFAFAEGIGPFWLAGLRYLVAAVTLGMVIGWRVEGLPVLTLPLVGIVLWLGVVNGAIAYFLWTWSQRWLKAYESSVLNNLVLIQVALLEVWWLAFRPAWWQVLGLGLVFAAILYIQLRPSETASRSVWEMVQQWSLL
ncbi:DMT family transporter [Desmospora activa]|uniref:EamA-like transporter family protein n=1 Tax=Desmospora activa DSM 45169 TaxID=1121389 RepID=A0A2T4ZAU1_9BACL|nr:DMT family transporter [Desmospora activa]PTM59008.1 EamA-like transporter family protein [Desmospora activa DSM 45169]